MIAGIFFGVGVETGVVVFLAVRPDAIAVVVRVLLVGIGCFHLFVQLALVLSSAGRVEAGGSPIFKLFVIGFFAFVQAVK